MTPNIRSGEFKPTTFLRSINVLKARFDSINTIVTSLQSQRETITPVQHKKLKSFLSELRKKYEDFEVNFDHALSYDGDDTIPEDTLIQEQNTINNVYTELVSSIEILLGNNEPDQIQLSSQSNASISTNQDAVRLPKLELIKFNGDYAKWTTFVNLFNTVIHENSSLSKTLKFQYLLSILENEPLNLIRNLSITDANYDVAYNILSDRYQNDRRLQLLHINRVIDLPEVSSSSITGIRQFLNIYNENMQALTAINCDIADSKHLLAAILLRKLDVDLRKRIENFRAIACNNKHTLPTVDEIINFLNQECNRHEDAVGVIDKRLQEMNLSSNTRNRSVQRRDSTAKNVVASSTPNNQFSSCAVCDTNNHKTFACQKFLAKSPSERYQIVKSRHHCISCLGAHSVKSCKSTSSCKICHKKHNTLLHFFNGHPDNVPNSSATNVQTSNSEITDSSLVNTQSNKTVSFTAQNDRPTSSVDKSVMVLLGTVLVNVRVANGTIHTFRALCDSGSMCSLITERAVALLNAPRQASNVQIVGINQRMSRNKGQIYGTLETAGGVIIAKDHLMIVLDQLTVNLPRAPVSPDVIQLTKQYDLADPTYHVPNRIDIILGAALFPQLFSGQTTHLGPDLPYLINSPFGHVVMGTTPSLSTSTLNTSQRSSTLNICFHSIPLDELHNSIQQFWLQEDVPAHQIQPKENIACENLFVTTHTRDETGRYVVRLPIKDLNISLGQSRIAAEQRLLAMERKFNKDSHFAKLYRDFMSEYITLGHMIECNEPSHDSVHYYLLHHGILKESSSTTKLRTVFDASCKSSSGLSLNDILMTGTKLQNNIADILMQFWRHHIVICCDIKQMYRQILIHPDDRHLQLILWRSDPSQAFKTFQLNTVTYGVNSSPYLAIRTLRQLALDEGHDLPDAAHALLHHTYVDDIITGAESLSSAVDLRNQLQHLLLRGGFELRKWVSNSELLLQTLPESHRESPKFLTDSTEPQFAVLGLHWSPSTDSFTFNSHGFHSSSQPTKRSVLSAIASIYDPCGFLTSFIILAKCFMQLIWTLGLCWDTPLPTEVLNHWNRLVEDTSCLSQISIPRSLNLCNTQTVELHGFCDASERGYAAAIYFKCSNNQSTITQLVIAKSRVAPLKMITIPRLELCAAHLLTKLTAHVTDAFHKLFDAKNIFLWSDSTIVLTWIQTPPYRLKTYVANRVAQIQEITPPECWRHVVSQDNPADCASRGYSLSQLPHHTLWWNGPEWLSHSPSEWPNHKFIISLFLGLNYAFHKLFDAKNIFLWSDSTIVLTWIQTPPYRLKTYVANRVAQIQEITPPECWRHVVSQDNPADCASRGYSLSQLPHHTLWWNGPEWLSHSPSEWPNHKFIKVESDELMELKSDPLPIFVVSSPCELPLLTRYSSWSKLLRITALVMRFIHNCKTAHRVLGPITVAELNTARIKIIFATQQSTLHKEFNELCNGKCPPNIAHLAPFIDAHQLIRVGGRLQKSKLAYDVKHPALLPKHHHVVHILIEYLHLKHLHAGPQFVQSVLTQHVWILNARTVIRSRLHKCITCHRHRNLTLTPIMADLPTVRTTPAKPFLSTGVDYMGPFSCKIINLRFIKIVKVYLSIFICMVTKAVHIEVVTDLTTDAFIAALTRFVSRRGICTDIYCDCGTNFVGANSELRKIVQSSIKNNQSRTKLHSFAATHAIRFHFNPPSAPHHGGLWERAVRSVKYHLTRIMGTSLLTLPELMTLTTRIEAILNSRPLHPMSNDPNDFDVLTPGHFLIGTSLISIPELDVTTIPSNRLKHWQLVQQFVQQLWKRWSLDYIHTLQQRTKWTKTSSNVKVGDLVLLKTDNNPLFWPRGRITEILPGSDNVVRVVKIKTKDGTYTRPVTQLCLLPLHDE